MIPTEHEVQWTEVALDTLKWLGAYLDHHLVFAGNGIRCTECQAFATWRTGIVHGIGCRVKDAQDLRDRLIYLLGD